MKDIDFIKGFNKIKITGICRKLKIDRSNVMHERTSKENMRAIREEIESEIAKLYIKE